MLTLVPGGMGGSETYARELVRELHGRDLDVRTVVAPVAAGFSQGLQEQVAPEYPTGPSSRDRVVALVMGVLRGRRLSRRTAGAEVVHYPFTVPVPRPHPLQRSVVTLLDVQHHDLPGLFSRVARLYRTCAYDRPARRADAVVTISNFCKSRIVQRLDIDPSKVHVAHLGVRTEDFPDGQGVREDFLLYPARAWPHKNHTVLFEAFVLLLRCRPTMRLVLTGVGPDEFGSLPEGVEARGTVTRAELADLYASAAALVFPSRYEGFGLPILEAMSAGCPVAAARSGSLPEVVGEAGVLFDGDDPADIARGVLEALDRSDELRVLGLARVQSFTWTACADAHVAVYRRLGG